MNILKSLWHKSNFLVRPSNGTRFLAIKNLAISLDILSKDYNTFVLSKENKIVILRQLFALIVCVETSIIPYVEKVLEYIINEIEEEQESALKNQSNHPILYTEEISIALGIFVSADILISSYLKILKEKEAINSNQISAVIKCLTFSLKGISSKSLSIQVPILINAITNSNYQENRVTMNAKLNFFNQLICSGGN